MKKRGGKRVQIKRLRFQIKQTFDLQKDPFHLLNTFQKLEAAPQIANSHTYHLIPLDFEINYPDYRQISQIDLRYSTYTLRSFWSRGLKSAQLVQLPGRVLKCIDPKTDNLTKCDNAHTTVKICDDSHSRSKRSERTNYRRCGKTATINFEIFDFNTFEYWCLF